MKIRNFITFTIIQALIISLVSLFFSNNSLASECDFDSYIILNGKCINLNKESSTSTNTSTVHRTIYRYNSPNEIDNMKTLLTKDCNDFDYQEFAQRYFDKHPEAQDILDTDKDGYACENLKRLKGGVLSLKIWNNLKYENLQRKLATSNKKSLSFSEVNNIIGFSPTSIKYGKTIWSDPMNNMKITIRFHQEYIMDMKGTGF